MNFVIGEKIKQKVEERGVTQKAFANAIGMTTRNLERFFERSDISINQLLTASDFLNYDFVSLYLSNHSSGRKLPKLEKDSEPLIRNEKKDEVSIQVNIKGDLTVLSNKLPELLSKMKREIESVGLHLG